MIIACSLLNFLQQNVVNRLVNKAFMIGCMTCHGRQWPAERRIKPTSVMTAQRHQTRSSSTTDSVTSIEHCMQTLRNLQQSKKLNYLHKINSYVFLKKKLNLVEQICI